MAHGEDTTPALLESKQIKKDIHYEVGHPHSGVLSLERIFLAASSTTVLASSKNGPQVCMHSKVPLANQKPTPWAFSVPPEGLSDYRTHPRKHDLS